MAEVNSEEIFVSFEVNISSNILSLSPLAFIIAVHLVGTDAVHDGRNVLGHISWSTELVIWDQFNSVRPGALSSGVIAVRLIVPEASVPVRLSHVSALWWMAEWLGEEWLISEFFPRAFGGSIAAIWILHHITWVSSGRGCSSSSSVVPLANTGLVICSWWTNWLSLVASLILANISPHAWRPAARSVLDLSAVAELLPDLSGLSW